MLEVFRRSTYVLCCLPLTPATTKCITTRHFEALGGDSYFINVSRGDVVDQDALVDALEAGTIAGAVLDVTSPEPLPEGHRCVPAAPRALFRRPRLRSAACVMVPDTGTYH